MQSSIAWKPRPDIRETQPAKKAPKHRLPISGHLRNQLKKRILPPHE